MSERPKSPLHPRTGDESPRQGFVHELDDEGRPVPAIPEPALARALGGNEFPDVDRGVQTAWLSPTAGEKGGIPSALPAHRSICSRSPSRMAGSRFLLQDL